MAVMAWARSNLYFTSRGRPWLIIWRLRGCLKHGVCGVAERSGLQDRVLGLQLQRWPSWRRTNSVCGCWGGNWLENELSARSSIVFFVSLAPKVP